MKNIIFLDIDGVLNCELFYKERFEKKIPHPTNDDEYIRNECCPERIKMLNQLCEETDSSIVVSSTWRLGRSIYELQELFNNWGGTFTVIGKTPRTGYERGTEIRKWLSDNCMEYFGVHSFEFFRYAIIDDDSDMLLCQAPHFFQTDSYSGLTYNTCHRIKLFFTHKTY